MMTLKKYKRVFKIRTKPNSTKHHLAQVISEHFYSEQLNLNELESISLFTRTVRCQMDPAAYSHHYETAAELPLLGPVAAGTPLGSVQQDERLNLNDLFAGAKNFALQVKGQSMIEDHIEDGDYVVIRKQESAKDGERVVAMINDEVTLITQPRPV